MTMNGGIELEFRFLCYVNMWLTPTTWTSVSLVNVCNTKAAKNRHMGEQKQKQKQLSSILKYVGAGGWDLLAEHALGTVLYSKSSTRWRDQLINARI